MRRIIHNQPPAKVSQCNICKKPRHIAKILRSQIPLLPKNRGQYSQRQQIQTRNVKNINEEKTQEIEPPLEEEDEIEKIDPEPTMYITDFMADWNTINIIEREFKNIKNAEINNMTPYGEIIIQTTLRNKNIINWLAATESSRSFIDIQTAEDLFQKERNMRIEKYGGQMKFKCCNNKDIPMVGQFQMDLSSDSWKATKCNMLVVEHK